ncbi:hypothetical protein [Kutzneria sp. 744]|uniref:hypothetical protein n=1 Tax=Kutzneria sp. (strain 744) TaxID=345341 RepID=UPI0003EEA693|nr:hypothetical protein [Kutzneria sp. 744]EWM11974.1 hypothetical protein KUTG_02278 [Kutzneria sp. 744]
MAIAASASKPSVPRAGHVAHGGHAQLLGRPIGHKKPRSEFTTKYTTSSFKTANVPVTITGVGFFDFLHGQTGVAPNGIELHSVLDVQFGSEEVAPPTWSSPPPSSPASGFRPIMD